MAVKKSTTKVKRKSANGSVRVTAKKMPTIKEPLSKGPLIKTIAELTNLGKKEVVSVFDCLTLLIDKHIKSGGPGVMVIPQLLKISVVKKPARPARKGINPFTGQEIMIKAKPASKAVKVKALKKLKEMVA